MKTTARLFFVCLLICLFPFSNKAQNDISSLGYPKYKSVVDHFFENYTSPKSDHRLFFEKRPEGYFVSISLEYPFEERIRRELIWSRKSKKFQPLTSYKTGSGGNDSEFAKRFTLQSHKIYESGVCPFTGYSGWQRDIISEYGKEENLPDTLLYSLARAYSTLTTGIVNNNFGNPDKLIQFDLPKGKNSLTEYQLESFRQYAQVAYSLFFKLHQQNPNFETIVGKVYTKYCNEIMWTFLILQYFQNEAAARKELKPDLYDEFYINAAKNYLNSCPPNAILFTYGDNDYYPLLYVQAQLGFRTDVLIAGTTLLNIDRYIDHLRDGVFDAPPFPSPFDSTFYVDDKHVQIFSEHPETPIEKIDLIKAIEFIQQESNRYNYQDKYFAYFPSSNFFLKIDRKEMMRKKIVPEYYQNSIVDEIRWKIPGYTTIKRDLMFLAAIAENNWERPICIGMTSGNETFVGMNDYFHLEGLAYRLLPVKAENKSPYLFGGINAEETYKKLMTEFLWGGIKKIEAGKKVYYQNYTLIFLETAKQLIKDGKKEKAEKLLNRFFEIFPNDVKNFENIICLFIEQYFILEKNEMAEKIGIQLIDNFSKKENLSDRETRAILQLEVQAKKYNSNILEKAIKKINW